MKPQPLKIHKGTKTIKVSFSEGILLRSLLSGRLYLYDVLTSYKYAFLLYVKFRKLVKSGKFIAREVRKTI